VNVQRVPDSVRPVPTASMPDEDAMLLAIEEARRALEHGDVPIGAVVLLGDRVIASRHNERELLQDPTAHAELLALKDASSALGAWRLVGTTLVVTVEPCLMCAGALVAARVERLVFGADDPRAGACGSLYNLCCDPRLNHEVSATGGVLGSDCAGLVTSFFADRRAFGEARGNRRPETPPETQ